VTADTAVLHALRLAGPTTTELVSAAVGRQAEPALVRLAAAGQVLRVGRRWTLTDDGLAASVRLVPPVTGPDRETVGAVYERMPALDQAVTAACAEWDLVPSGDDPDHDDILDRLAGVLDLADDLLARVADRLPRFDRYRDRLRAALAAAEDGDVGYVCDPGLDSFRTVWSACLADLRVALG
jgi:hypothetical protein